MTKPLVTVDARMVGNQTHGIAKFVKCIASGLSQLNSVSSLNYRLHFLLNKNTDVFDFFKNFEVSYVETPFLNVKEIFTIPSIIKKIGTQLYHSPSFSSLLYSPCPYIQTIYDLNHLHFGTFTKKFYYHTLLKSFAKNSQKIITVSKTSRTEIEKWLRIPPDKLKTVSCALEQNLNDPSQNEVNRYLESLDLKFGKYFFSLVNEKTHKNFPFLIKCFQSFFKKHGRLDIWPLVINLSTQLEKGKNIHSLTELNDSEVQLLMAGAGAFVAPSLYEGFGLTPIEAVLLGTPTILSDIPAHRESLGSFNDPGILFLNPKNNLEWENAFEQALFGKISKPQQSTQAVLQQKYSLNIFANSMDDIYQEVLSDLN